MNSKDDFRVVAVYARVSTEHEAQISALDNQVQYYDDILDKHPNWKLYERYIDEGITGTSVNKRKNFMRMIEDAHNGKFDLIITREVSRFARNTVDALQETRKLKKIGVEVWFTEDNIWTMNDEDGELRLTIMATLAQNESKKTSMRSKAGQMISFKNGVFYGNGNILGYDRDGKEMVVNPEQADTVRRIFEMYAQGNGVKEIRYTLEAEGRRTATGLTNWQCGNISRILRNSFYCGIIEYRKQFVPDYLEQKKINNHGQVEKITVNGSHEPIISKDLFFRCQERLDERSRPNGMKGRYGKRSSDDVYARKLKCRCGSSMHKTIWHNDKNTGKIQYAFYCFNQQKNGSYRVRLKRGLDVSESCDIKMVQRWKLEAMAAELFKGFWNDKEQILRITEDMLNDYINNAPKDDYDDKKARIESRLSEINKKYDRLLELRINDEIDKPTFDKKRLEILDEKDHTTNELLDIENSELEKETSGKDAFLDKLEVLKYGLEQNFQFDYDNIPDEIIEKFVREIQIVDDNTFIWKLKFDDFDKKLYIRGNSKKHDVSLEDFIGSFNTDEQDRLPLQINNLKLI